jgi:hypothetical protein
MAALTAAEKLTEAREALHSLLTGKRSVMMQYEGTRVQFTQANVDELRQYIAQLEGEVDPTKRRRPFRVFGY